jgi:osmotically-inducible protein OsmY
MAYNRYDNAEQPEEFSTIGRSASVPGEERPDERIREDVCDRLMQLGPADCTEIDVDVLDGVVTLRGAIPGDEAKNKAATVVQSVVGVRSVTNDLRIG